MRTRRVVSVAVTLFAIACGLVWLVRGRSPRENELAGVAPVALAQPEASGAIDAATPRSATREPALADGEIAAHARSSDSDPIVRIVDGASGEAVSGADVRVWIPRDPSTRLSWSDDSPWVGTDAEHAIESSGSVHTSDVRGIVHVPGPIEAALVVARKDDRIGFAEIQGGAFDDPVVRVWQRRALDVRVVGDRDEPATCEVGLLVDGSIVGWRARADADGRVRIPNVLALASVLDHTGSSFAVRALVPSQPPVEAWFDFATLPTETIELPLGAHGSIAVRIVDGDGEVQPVDGTVGIDHVEGRDIAPPSAEPGLSSAAPLRAGRARIEHVAVGARVRIAVRFASGARTRVSVEGPRSAGEIVDVPIPLGPRALIANGRIVDGDDVPIAGATFAVQPLLVDGTDVVQIPQPTTFTSDALGRFALVIDRDAAAVAPGATGRFVLWLDERDGERRQGSASMPCDVTRAAELGDVRASSRPIARGVVVDDAGTPVRNASVVLQQALVPGAEDSMIETRRARTDENGAFEIAGVCGGIGVILYVESLAGDAGFESPMVEVDCAREARIELRVVRRGSLQGSCLLDAHADVELDFAFEHAAGDVERSWSATADARGARFRIDDLEPGLGTLIVRDRKDAVDHASGRELARVSNLAIERGRITRDPRIDPIDLRGKTAIDDTGGGGTTELTLTIVDERESPIPRGAVLVWPADRGSPARCDFVHGRARVRASPESIVEVWAAGKLGACVTPRSPLERVVLPDAPEVEIHVRGLAALGRAGDERSLVYWMRAGVEGAPGRLPPWTTPRQTVELDSDGRARFRAPLLGRYAFEVRIQRRDPNDPVTPLVAATSELTPHELEIVDARPLHATIALDPDGLVELSQQLDPPLDDR